jgi:hypothetical protein
VAGRGKLLVFFPDFSHLATVSLRLSATDLSNKKIESNQTPVWEEGTGGRGEDIRKRGCGRNTMYRCI